VCGTLPGESDIALVLGVFMFQSVFLMFGSRLHGIIQFDLIFCHGCSTAIMVFNCREIVNEVLSQKLFSTAAIAFIVNCRSEEK
jgi:hypothetical protein